MFEILDIMNVADGDNNTDHLGVCPDLIEANTSKKGGRITMGVPHGVVEKLLGGKNIKPVLLLINLDEYNKVKKKYEKGVSGS